MEVSLAGPRYDGKYFVERVTHQFTSKVGPESGYMTRFVGARLNANVERQLFGFLTGSTGSNPLTGQRQLTGSEPRTAAFRR